MHLSNRRKTLALLLGAGLAVGCAAAPTGVWRPFAAQWLDDRGLPYDLAGLQGRWVVMTMAYGACRRICSTSLRLMEELQSTADREQVALNFVVVGLDPAQDKPADWAEWRQLRKLQRPNWAFLSGDERSVRDMAQRLGVRYWRYDGHIMHDFRIVLIGPDGHVQRSLDSFNDPLRRMLP